MAAAAAVVLAAASLWRFHAAPGAATGWQVAQLDGAAQLGNRNAELSMGLRAGQVLRTAKDSTLMLEDDALGRVDLGAGFGDARDQQPPVAAESREAARVHLGAGAAVRGGYALGARRRSGLRVHARRRCRGRRPAEGGDWAGWRFSSTGTKSFIPAGAQCVTRKRTGPGIPYYEDAPAALAQSVARFERGDTAALDGILAAARPRDGLTLWHLLTRVPAQDRAAVFDRFAQLVKLPPEVSRERVLRKDPAMIDLCWNALELENTGWWRGWERNWGPGVRGQRRRSDDVLRAAVEKRPDVLHGHSQARLRGPPG